MDLTTLSGNLRRWRTIRGKSQSDLAIAAELSRVGYRNIESGETAPRIDTLMKIARALDVRLDDLLAPVRPLTAVRFRADKKMTTREELISEVSRWLDDYSELESLTGEVRKFALDEVRKMLPKTGRGPARAKAAAQSVRQAMNLDHEHGKRHRRELIRDICGLLEDNGIKVIARPVASEGFFGLSVDDPERGAAIAVNVWDRLSVERWIFTAAHELGHLVLHHAAYEVANADEEPVEEKEADVFASQLLMPDELFVDEWAESRGLSLVDRVFKLKGIFRVSWRTVLYRADQLHPRAGVWGRFIGDYARERGTTLGKTDEPDALRSEAFGGRPSAKIADEPNHVPRNVFCDDRLHRLVRTAYEKELISIGRAAEILRYDTTRMRALANSWVE